MTKWQYLSMFHPDDSNAFHLNPRTLLDLQALSQAFPTGKITEDQDADVVTIDVKTTDPAMWNFLGSQGWELFAIDDTGHEFYLKRPLPE